MVFMQSNLLEMINYFFQSLSRNFFLILLKFNFKRTQNYSFNDLNFKQSDLTNYKLIKNYVLKDNFIKNISITNIHTFDFILLYQKIGGKKGIDLSKINIFTWFEKYKFYKNFLWKDDYSSKRFINIVYNYDFLCSISNEKEIKKIKYILNFHIRRIVYEIKRKKPEDISSFEFLALILIECIQKNYNISLVNKINEIINLQIDECSMHRSYNILEHVRFLNNLIEVKNIFLFFNKKTPLILNKNILAMTSLLKTYRHDDFSLPLFNGCNNNHIDEIQKISEREQFLRTKPLTSFKNGIAVYKDINKVLFFDVVQPTKFGYHKELSASSLAIEISAGGEKIITNCGGSEGSGKNPAYLKYSAAHSTIVINNTNISEIKEREINKTFPKEVFYETKDEEETKILSGTHNGYLLNYKKICKRKIIISKKNNFFIGEDTIISSKSNIDKNVFHIRFHLMPEISTTVTENKKNVIIKTKKNSIWMFKSNNEIIIENSIFVKNDIAIQTSQIVISGITSSLKNKIQWSLEKI
tara:strand:- start:1257 stop:2837 length:1581 start_codon:yes stop_codon:yes gene_type:complete